MYLSIQILPLLKFFLILPLHCVYIKRNSADAASTLGILKYLIFLSVEL